MLVKQTRDLSQAPEQSFAYLKVARLGRFSLLVSTLSSPVDRSYLFHFSLCAKMSSTDANMTCADILLSFGELSIEQDNIAGRLTVFFLCM